MSDPISSAAARYEDGNGESRLLESGARSLLARLRSTSGKTCSSCQETKPLTSFGADSSRKDGLEPRCRSCRTRRATTPTNS